MGKSYMADNRELTYRTWRECGQNIELTIKTLKDREGLPITKPTIYSWIEKYNWKERAARAEVEEQKVNDVIVSDAGKILADLEKQKAKYERFFDSLGDLSIDNQAMYAYTSLVKTIVEIKARIAAYKSDLFTEFLRDLIEWLSKNDPGSMTAIEHNFDDFVTYAKERYAHKS
ncbi:MAG TPA: hypothetical protein P5244_07255 [Syntrophales bacterium]|jgi:hypothetical protein|nr:hypothetical protein [Syntrophales bacterium]